MVWGGVGWRGVAWGGVGWRGVGYKIGEALLAKVLASLFGSLAPLVVLLAEL